jgi:MFS family permease
MALGFGTSRGRKETMLPLTPTPRIRRMQLIVMVLLMCGGVINYFDRSALAVANVLIRHDLGLSATAMGVLLSAFLLAYAFAQIPLGILIDKLGPRILLTAGIALWSLVQTLSGLATGFGQFYFARIALGATEATQFPTGIRVVSNWFNVAKRGLPTGIFNSSSMLGTALAPPVLTVIMLTFGWRWMFISIGLAGVFMAVVWWTVYRDPEVMCDGDEIGYLRAGDTERTSSPVNLRQWSRLFRYRATWGMIIGSLGGQYLTWMYYTWLPGFLVMQQHMSLAQTGIFAAIPPFAGILGSWFGGYSTDWFCARGFAPLTARKIPTVTAFIGTAALTIATAYAGSNTAVVTLISFSYLLSGLSSAAIWSMVTASAPPDYVGSFGSIHLFGGYIGATCSPIITGFIVDVTGSFMVALLIGAGMELVGAVAFLMVTRPISGVELDGRARLAVPPRAAMS